MATHIHGSSGRLPTSSPAAGWVRDGVAAPRRRAPDAFCHARRLPDRAHEPLLPEVDEARGWGISGDWSERHDGEDMGGDGHQSVQVHLRGYRGRKMYKVQGVGGKMDKHES